MDSLIYLGTHTNFTDKTNKATSKLIRLKNSDQIIINVPEGTQTRLMESTATIGKTKKILITDLSHDKINGLPGFLCSLGCAFRKEDPVADSAGEHQNLSAGSVSGSPQKKKLKSEPPEFILEIYGPVGLAVYLRTVLKLGMSFLGYKYRVIEINFTQNSPENLENSSNSPEYLHSMGFTSDSELHFQELKVQNFQLFTTNLLFQSKKIGEGNNQTDLSCYCFSLDNSTINYIFTNSSKIGKLDAKKLKQDGLPAGKLYQQLKAGQVVKNSEGKEFHPQDYISADIPGNCLVVLQQFSDLRPNQDLPASNSETPRNTLISLPEKLLTSQEFQQNKVTFTVNQKFSESCKNLIQKLSPDRKKVDIFIDHLSNEQEVVNFETDFPVKFCEFGLIHAL